MKASSKLAGAASVHAAATQSSHAASTSTSGKRPPSASKASAGAGEGGPAVSLSPTDHDHSTNNSGAGIELSSVAVDILSPLHALSLSPASSTGSASPKDLEEGTIYLSLYIEMTELSDIQQTFRGAGQVTFRFVHKG